MRLKLENFLKKNKNTEARPKLTGSYKKRVYG